jgi:hypothetical protein
MIRYRLGSWTTRFFAAAALGVSGIVASSPTLLDDNASVPRGRGYLSSGRPCAGSTVRVYIAL